MFVCSGLKIAIMDIEDSLGDHVESLELPRELAERFEEPMGVDNVNYHS